MKLYLSIISFDESTTCAAAIRVWTHSIREVHLNASLSGSPLAGVGIDRISGQQSGLHSLQIVNV